MYLVQYLKNYDFYKERPWKNFDKLKDFDLANEDLNIFGHEVIENQKVLNDFFYQEVECDLNFIKKRFF